MPESPSDPAPLPGLSPPATDSAAPDSAATKAPPDDPAERPRVILQRGQSTRLRRGHPWVFSNEVVMTPEARALPPGGLVTLEDAGGERLGVATFTAHSLIAARLLDPDPLVSIDVAWIRARLARALGLRRAVLPDPAFGRLIHGEADGLPGLVIDRMGPVVVLQAHTAGMERLTPLVVEAVTDLLAPQAVILANTASVRALEGLNPETRLAFGTWEGPVPVQENGLTYRADPLGGQKTGWFYDQRPNRALVADLARGRRVLDLYSYAGGFGLLALARGAKAALLVDRTDAGLALAREAAAEAGLAAPLATETAEVFAFLEARGRGQGRGPGQAADTFGVVICDPPAFAKTRKDQAAAAKGYRKLARLAAPLVDHGGFLVTASCSAHMPADRFREETARGLHQAGRSGRLIHQGGAGPDHPLHPALPETAYLKTLIWHLD